MSSPSAVKRGIAGEQRLCLKNSILLSTPSDAWETDGARALGNTSTSQCSGEKGDAKGACGALGQAPLALLDMPRETSPEGETNPAPHQGHHLAQNQLEEEARVGCTPWRHAHKAHSHTANCTAQPREGPCGSDRCQQTRKLISGLPQDRQSATSPH